MTILLLGKNGQVARALQRSLLPLGDVVALSHAECDLENPDGLRAVLAVHRPAILVNAAAYTAVDKAESEEARAFAVNAAAVAILAEYARANAALLVHYSTDYVFDGSKTTPYVETDATAPLNAYGRSKLAGEQAIAQSGCAALVLRTSWVFSAEGSNFVKTILRLAGERASLAVVADQVGAPTSAELIAQVTSQAIAAHRGGALASGLYHLTASGETSWHGFTQHIVVRARANGAALKLDPAQLRPIATEEYPLPAARPKNSRLDTSKLSIALGMQLPDWKIHADRVIDQLTS